MLRAGVCNTLGHGREHLRRVRYLTAGGSPQAQIRHGMRLKDGGMNEPHPVHSVWRVKCRELSTPHGAHTAIHIHLPLLTTARRVPSSHRALPNTFCPPLQPWTRLPPSTTSWSWEQVRATTPPHTRPSANTPRSHRMRSFRVTRFGLCTQAVCTDWLQCSECQGQEGPPHRPQRPLRRVSHPCPSLRDRSSCDAARRLLSTSKR
jgi:hypothetical protein